MIPVIQQLRTRNSMEAVVCVTGQHREMMRQVFATFDEKADIDLDVMASGQSLSSLTALMLSRLTDVMATEKPDLVLVHGDTTTAFAAATAAFYSRRCIGHVEAGLRSYDLDRPWPEEFNRVAIDAIANLRFAPTKAAAANLEREYSRGATTVITGNTGIDSLLFMAARLNVNPDIAAAVSSRYTFLDARRHLILVTGHRRESFGLGFEGICDGLCAVAARGDVQIVYPVHLNPEVQKIVRGRLARHPDVFLIDPVDYLDMVFLMQRAKVLITDSGGIQEEGPALGRPVLVMRDVTERPEAIASGSARLIGTCSATMRREVDRLLDDAVEYAARSVPCFPYGDGHAAERVVNTIEEFAQ